MRMQLRIQRTARIMRKLRIHQLPRHLIIVRPDILPVTHTDRRQSFQLRHRNPNRLLMRCQQPLIEHRHDGYRLRRRYLKIKKSWPSSHILLRQFPMRLRIDIPLKQTELLARHDPATQAERICQLSQPISIHPFMLRIIIVRRKMIHIKTLPRSITRTYLCHIEHRTMLLSLFPSKIHTKRFARLYSTRSICKLQAKSIP